MFIEKGKVGRPGAFILGCRGIEAAVIDPRRDCVIYVEIAAQNGAGDHPHFRDAPQRYLVSGAPALSKLTGAPVHHGPNPAGPVRYADTVCEGQTFQFGDLTTKVLETPGHTMTVYLLPSTTGLLERGPSGSLPAMCCLSAMSAGPTFIPSGQMRWPDCFTTGCKNS